VEDRPREGVHPAVGSSAWVAAKRATMSAWRTDTSPAYTTLPIADAVKVVSLVMSVSRDAVLPHSLINRAVSAPTLPTWSPFETKGQ
jgi:hypothetical protein